ncbi:acyltransferase family protein [Cohnella nanjingensis]|uniref:Acyltransferase family protein n=1 Tax=Cohnella nanjingensis TaxID=1387779 RepID=A0A7X0RQG5_9BACL|nr:acyltransferase family protein [Cohnella nanjingensis]MBB6671578.1 acyltransferase family protein [Cohnella nanjingensis]
MEQSRLRYIDSLRVFLTALVIWHHTAITYGASGSWYYIEYTSDELTATTGILSLFTGVNQAFFMGFFFLLSGYFIPASYDRKGAARFLKERFIRLGIPLLIYVFLIGPSLIYAIAPAGKGTYGDFYREYVLTFRLVNWGPLWFVETLLYMAIVYVIVRGLMRQRRLAIGADRPSAFPSHTAIFLSALLIGAASFLIRLIMPTGEEVLGLQLGYFSSYVFLFVVGIVAYRRDWFTLLSAATARFWFRISLCVIPFLPIAVVLGGLLGPDEASINGGWSWLALFYAFWEPFVALGMIMYLLVRFRGRFDRQSPWMTWLANRAYAVYIIHPPIVVAVCYTLRGGTLPAMLKFLIAGLLATALCFGIAGLLRRIPWADRVL